MNGYNKKHESKLKNKGFTLVEIIVVLLILSILAAVAIPTMLGFTDNAKEKLAIYEARQCALAAQTIAMNRYVENKAYDLAADEGETLELAEAPAGGDIQLAEFNSNSKLTKMVYKASNGMIVTYENNSYSVSKEGGMDFSDSDSLAKIYDIMKSVVTNPDGKYYYSGTKASEKFVDEFKKNGIDLNTMAKNWSIRYNANNSYPKLYWTDEDISGKKKGDTVTVMAYTLSTGRYTVWNVKLTEVDGKLCLGNEDRMVTKVESKDQSYEQMITDYNNAIKK